VVKVELLKGKAHVPETTELNLADLIDIKGIKAQGNRLSQHEIKAIELIAEHDDEEDVPDPVAEVSLKEIVSEEHKEEEAEKEISQKEEPIIIPAKKIELEITNPEEVDLKGKGQLPLF
jgi:topoisomerase-4 subunit A